jgi:hypothetical protein
MRPFCSTWATLLHMDFSELGDSRHPKPGARSPGVRGTDEIYEDAKQFGAMARLYMRARPEIPLEFGDFMRSVGFYRGMRLVEFGPGGGQFTRVLLDLEPATLDVVDRTDQFRDDLLMAYPGIRFHHANALEVDLPRGGADGLASASTPHWLEKPDEYPDAPYLPMWIAAHNCLRQGGIWLGGVTQKDITNPLMNAMKLALEEDFKTYEWPIVVSYDVPEMRPPEQLFTPLQVAHFPFTFEVNRLGYLEHALSYSYVPKKIKQVEKDLGPRAARNLREKLQTTLYDAWRTEVGHERKRVELPFLFEVTTTTKRWWRDPSNLTSRA